LEAGERRQTGDRYLRVEEPTGNDVERLAREGGQASDWRSPEKHRSVWQWSTSAFIKVSPKTDR
jgi:hypothetical protein